MVNTSQWNETELLRSAAGGDKEAFRRLVDKYHPLVAATVIGMLGAGPEAEDIGQETFLRLYSTLNRFRGEASVGTYLTRIAMNLSLNEIRRRKRLAFFGIRLSKSDEFQKLDGQAEAEFRDFHQSIERAILRLEPAFRAVAVLCWMDGHTFQEAAAILEIPIGTALSRLHRARKLVRAWLTPNKEDGRHG